MFDLLRGCKALDDADDDVWMVMCWTLQMWHQLRSLAVAVNLTAINDESIIFHIITGTERTRSSYCQFTV